MRKTILFLVVVCFFTNAAFASKPLVKKSSELKHITHRIYQLTKSLFTIKSKQRHIKINLQSTELKIGHVAQNISYTKLQLSKKQRKLTGIQRKQQYYQRKLDVQKRMLAKQVRAAYMLGRQPGLKIVLNQENPAKISRYLHYYMYFNQARLKVIRDIIDTFEHLTETGKSIKKETLSLQQINNRLRAQKNIYNQERYRRQHLLNKTNRELRNKKQKLQKLRADKKHLENIIKKLSLEQSFTLTGKRFYQAKGKLHWPIIDGRLVQRYGQKIAGGRMRSTGILLSAATGTKVYAVFPGKVIFANWLHGFGLLVIIQHGRYMTLYGRNQSLYVKPGTMIHAGEVIATVGNSGGFQNSGLYFEIRYRAKPVNPQYWLQRKRT